MIEDIATDVSNKLNLSAPCSDFDGLIGMESQMVNMGPLLQLDSDEVRKIGIWGPPGIGKTILARYIFNRYSREFELSVFMDNIKRKYSTTACSDDYSVKLDLQEQLVSKLTNVTDIKNFSHLGIVKDRLKDKKVLVVLDDVDHLVQVEAMAKETCWFGPGSRIIITTQDQRVLKASGINHIHRVILPSYDEALQIFCVYAFGQKYPKDGFKKLAYEVINLVNFLPLGLRVMGSYFRGMSEQDWTETLPKLRTHLDRDGEIASILKFSYDSLCDEDKLLFLHIACFFNDVSGVLVEGCLANKVSDVKHGLHVLADKSLIDRYIQWGRIEMDTLLVQLGRKIVREESLKEPGKRQFLTDAVDIGEVLSDDDRADSSSVIGINLEQDEEITCTSERAFERLCNLQFLRINNLGGNPQSMNHISQKLRVLIWPRSQMTCFPSSFNPKFLVKLVMRNSKLKKLWEETKPLSNLKWMDLSRSRRLEELPDLSTATNLRDLNLSDCSSLVKLPSSIGNAINLQYLTLSHCSNLVEIPSSIGNAINLIRFCLFNCSSLVEIPSCIATIASLKSLELRGCSSLVELPLNIERFISEGTCIRLYYFSSLVKLPFSIGNAVNLKNLNLHHCSSLVELPSSIGYATNLQKLKISYCPSLMELPFSIGNAINLKKLELNDCSSLVELPFSIGNLVNLQKLNLHGCSSLVKLPSSIGNLNLKELNLHGCSSLVKIPFVNAVNLQKLRLSNCSSLMELPSSIWTAINLQELYLSNCSNMVELPSFMKCTKLQVIVESLEEVDLSGCSLLKSYPESSTDIQELDPWIGRLSLSGPRRLVLNGMKKLVSLPQLPDSIVELTAEDCESLERLDCSFDNPDIFLNFRNCFKLNQEARDLIIQSSKFAILPGEEVPQCFTYRSSGSSVTVKLNQLPLGKSNKFKAGIICAGEDESEKKKWESAYVCCRITAGGNTLYSYYNTRRVFTGHLCTFEVEVEAEELTSTELLVEFEIQFTCTILRNSETMKIIECGMLQHLEVPSLSS